jgi:hypothetical protein
MLIIELPFATPLRGNAKFTNPGAAETESEVFRTAFRLTLAVLELSWARAVDDNPPVAIKAARRAKGNAALALRVCLLDWCLDKEVKFRFSALHSKRGREPTENYRTALADHLSGVASTFPGSPFSIR